MIVHATTKQLQTLLNEHKEFQNEQFEFLNVVPAELSIDSSLGHMVINTDGAILLKLEKEQFTK